MKITRNQFLKLIPAAALTLTGCGSKAQPANTESLVFSHHYKLDYAQQFTADCYEGGYTMLTIAESDARFLVVPEDAAEVDGLPADVTVLRQPVENIYLVSTSVMDLLLHLDALEVKEQLEHFGIPVLVERSSYESDPLARMEWIKLYGILLGREEQAEQVFSAQETAVQPILSQKPTGKSCAFFSLTTNNLATVRKGSDYVARMIEMAGGSYVFADLTDNGNSLATMNLPLEDFYAGAKDADVLIYNSAIEGMIASVSQLTERFPLLNEFKAVKEGQVWCTTQSLFQQSMELADLIVDMNRVFTKGTPAASTLKFLTHVD